MDQRIRQQAGQRASLEAGVRQIQIKGLYQDLASKQEQEAEFLEETDAGAATDTVDPEDLDDAGEFEEGDPEEDSFDAEQFQSEVDLSLEDDDNAESFDETFGAPAVWLQRLPIAARPRVRYRIDPDFVVHKLYKRETLFSKVQYAIACAIAKHLQRTGFDASCQFWWDIPAIGENANLVALMEDESVRTDSRNKLKGMGTALKNFALYLPNNDVVAASALLEAARRGKSATRAAALSRTRAQLPTLAGEPWTKEDWRQFEHTQSGKGSGAKKVGKTKRR